MKRLISSLLKSFRRAFRENEYVENLRNKYPRFFQFLEKRLSRNERYGLSFSFYIGLAFLILFFFLGIAQDIIFRDPFVEVDVRIMNLVASLRDIQTAKFFLFFTYLGNIQIIASLGIIILILLWLSGKWRMAKLFFVSIISGEFLYYLVKLLIHRTRPDISFSLIPRDGYAFPSGHATISIIFYGMLGFLLWHLAKKRWQKSLIAFAVMTIVFLVGFSRVYLGVHWTSDVLAGWSFGLSVLILFIAIYNERGKSYLEEERKSLLSRQAISVLAVALIFLEGLFIYYFYTKHPLQFPAPQSQSTVQVRPSLSSLESVIASKDFSKFSETLSGQQMEPISFFMIGSKEQLVKSFEDSGWFQADEVNPQRLVLLAKTAIFNQKYLTAPVTPAFYDKKSNNLAFEKPTESLTVKQRHHIRFWLTDLKYGNDPVWVATASFDDGLKYFVTHKIKPDVDTEREFIYNDLVRNNKVREEEKIQFVSPMLGQNQSGDQFFTDGKAYIIIFD